MEFDSWILLLVTFWLGSLIGFAASAMIQLARRADVKRARSAPPSLPIASDLQPDTLSRF